MTHVLELDRAVVSRNSTTILDSASWATDNDQHWAILGPNGAGKTTLLRAAVGREPLDSGTASFAGAPVTDIDPAELATRIGFASSSLAPRVRPRTLVGELVRTAAWGVHVGRGLDYEDVDDERAADLMAAFGVSPLADRTFSSLSQGEAQRVLLARSLMTDPEVLVLDEPTAGLDLGAREMLVAALTEIISGPAAPQIVLVTHQVEEIPEGITHAALMSGGRIVAAGPIEETLTGVALSHAFALPLTAGRSDGRWWARGI
ncbi:ATP-binding cassette domain-containing protein [Actinomyces sp. B33]|uniref:ABC transporter ATP-binding protein n=1 Tax=Actinomyces sp. B33 TaxID=2942131 RepID=UPI002341F06F|nr:ATP-binding cassette domain-containing protein [Actinomyces sp. B33]MDC4233212.1 ATP-binding cassette domain-containing protein [Actinomyces sp. B33]